MVSTRETFGLRSRDPNRHIRPLRRLQTRELGLRQPGDKIEEPTRGPEPRPVIPAVAKFLVERSVAFLARDYCQDRQPIRAPDLHRAQTPGNVGRLADLNQSCRRALYEINHRRLRRPSHEESQPRSQRPLIPRARALTYAWESPKPIGIADSKRLGKQADK